MEKCSLYCVTKETDTEVDILTKSDKKIKVVIPDTNITVTLSRSDTRSPYIGWAGKLEFETFGELD